jgi:hypothetical protein
MLTHFVVPVQRKKRLGQRRLSDVLCRRMYWEFIICLLEVLKNDSGGVCMNHFLKVSKGLANSFCASWATKKRLQRSRLSADLSRRMVLWKHRLLDVFQNDFSEVDEAIFQGVERPCELIFCILGIKKRHGRIRLSDDLSKWIDLRTHYSPSRRINKGPWWSRWSDVSGCRKAMRTQFLHPVHQKKRIGRSRLSDILSRRMGLRTHNLASGRLKKHCSSTWSDVSRCRKAMRTIFVVSLNRKNRLGRSRLLCFM